MRAVAGSTVRTLVTGGAGAARILISVTLLARGSAPETVHIVYQTQYLSDAYAVQAALIARGVAATVLGEHSIGTVGGGVTVQVATEAGARLARHLLPRLGLSAQGGQSSDRAV